MFEKKKTRKRRRRRTFDYTYPSYPTSLLNASMDSILTLLLPSHTIHPSLELSLTDIFRRFSLYVYDSKGRGKFHFLMIENGGTGGFCSTAGWGKFHFLRPRKSIQGFLVPQGWCCGDRPVALHDDILRSAYVSYFLVWSSCNENRSLSVNLIPPMIC